MKYLAIGLLCLLATGCGLGPAHLDAFYSERNRYQSLIDDIERHYSLPSRDSDKGQVPALKDSVAQLKKENEILRAQLDALKQYSGHGN